MRKTAIGVLAAGLAVAGSGLVGSGASARTTHNVRASAATSHQAFAATSRKASAAASCPDNPVQFAVEPYDSGTTLLKVYATLANDLAKKLGCNVHLEVTSNYVQEIEAMRGGKVDIGEFGPLGYVFAKKIAGAQAVATFGSPDRKPTTYTAGIWVAKNSPIKSLKQLHGKSLALSETTSTSGALEPVFALDQAGFHCKQDSTCSGINLKFTGGHPQDLLALTHGTVDAAEINSQEESVAETAHQFNPGQFREIWKSAPIPNDPIAVRTNLPVAFKKRVASILQHLGTSQIAAVDKELGTGAVGPLIPAPVGLYNGIAALAAKEGLGTSALG
jgi:phosphonate transport system substrate-binding protein